MYKEELKVKLKEDFFEILSPEEGEKEEEVLWEGKPSISSIVTQHQFDLYIDIQAVFIIFVVAMGIILPFITALSVLWRAIIFTLFTLYLYYKYLNIRDTKYRVTSKGIYINTRRGAAYHKHFVDFNNVSNAWIERFSDRSATIHLLPKVNKGQKTYHLFFGTARHYPTMELVAEAEEVIEIINDALQKNRDKKRVK